MIRFQHIGKKRRIFHSLLHIFHLFCNTRPNQTTPILFIQISTTMVYGIILICLTRDKIIHSNKLSHPLNYLRIFLFYHMSYLDLRFLVKRKKNKREKKPLFCPLRPTKRILHDKTINNKHYLSSNR